MPLSFSQDWTCDQYKKIKLVTVSCYGLTKAQCFAVSTYKAQCFAVSTYILKELPSSYYWKCSVVTLGCGSHGRYCQAESTVACSESGHCCIDQFSGTAFPETAVSGNSKIDKNRSLYTHWLIKKLSISSIVSVVGLLLVRLILHLMGQLVSSDAGVIMICLVYWILIT